jgi:hypothetical protein
MGRLKTKTVGKYHQTLKYSLKLCPFQLYKMNFRSM